MSVCWITDTPLDGSGSKIHHRRLMREQQGWVSPDALSKRLWVFKQMGCNIF